MWITAAVNVKPQFVTNAAANQLGQLMTSGLPHCSQGGTMKVLRAVGAFFFLSALRAGGPKILFNPADSLGSRTSWLEFSHDAQLTLGSSRTDGP